MYSLSPPKSASPQLHLEASKILARLARIVVFQPWISSVHTESLDDLRLLYFTLALGKPLCILLDLLGCPTSSLYSNEAGDDDGTNLFSISARERFITAFISNVSTLEARGTISYGEIMRVSDLLGGGTAGFSRVLKTISRVLTALQELHPGLYTLPTLHASLTASQAEQKRRELVEDIIALEQKHIILLNELDHSAAVLQSSAELLKYNLCLECLLGAREPLIAWHQHLLCSLQNLLLADSDEAQSVDWERVLRLDDKLTITQTLSSYRAICSNWLGLWEAIWRTFPLNSLPQEAATILQSLPELPVRLQELLTSLRQLRDLSVPITPLTQPPQSSVSTRPSAERKTSWMSLASNSWSSIASSRQRTYSTSTESTLSSSSASSTITARVLSVSPKESPRIPALAGLKLAFRSNSSLSSSTTAFGNFKTSFDTLLSAIQSLGNLWDGILEMSKEVRSLNASAVIFQALPLPEDFGLLTMDDYLRVNVMGSDAFRAVFLFHTSFIICSLPIDPSFPKLRGRSYPIREWEYGPTLQSLWLYHCAGVSPEPKYNSGVIRVIHRDELGEGTLRSAAPTSISLVCPIQTRYPPTSSGTGSIPLEEMVLTCEDPQQHSQWVHALRGIVGRVEIVPLPEPPLTPLSDLDEDLQRSLDPEILEHSPYEDSDLNSLRSGHSFTSEPESFNSIDPDTQLHPPRLYYDHSSTPSSGSGVAGLDFTPRLAKPWSLIGRKGPRSESSSFVMPIDDAASIRSERPGSQDSYVSEKDPASIGDSSTGLSMDGIIADLPDVRYLTNEVTKAAQYPEASGGYADVWKAVWSTEAKEQIEVAVKVLRVKWNPTNGAGDNDGAIAKLRGRFMREVRVHSTLSHPNILPLFGLIEGWGWGPGLVSPWLSFGSVSKYLERAGDLVSVRDKFTWLHGIAAGLQYLHSLSIVHGDLTGSNVLLTPTRQACLCDFGLSSVFDANDGQFSNTSLLTAGAIRWTDIVLHRARGPDAEGVAPTKNKTSDIYSFGSVMLELLTARIPYHYISMDIHVAIMLNQGEKPRRPTAQFVTEEQWVFIQHCWDDLQESRPSIEEVLEGLAALQLPDGKEP